MLGHIDLLQHSTCPVVNNPADDANIVFGFELKGLIFFVVADHQQGAAWCFLEAFDVKFSVDHGYINRVI